MDYHLHHLLPDMSIVQTKDIEAIYEFEVQDMPVTVAVDAEGQSVHHLAPLVWQEKIKKEGLLERV